MPRARGRSVLCPVPHSCTSPKQMKGNTRANPKLRNARCEGLQCSGGKSSGAAGPAPQAGARQGSQRALRERPALAAVPLPRKCCRPRPCMTQGFACQEL